MKKSAAAPNGAKQKSAQPPTGGAIKLRDAASYISVSIPTMHRLVKSGLIKPCRSIRHQLFAISELDRFIYDGMT
jgi:helix-turn-helix protein